jgi:SpoVK/Ycf46/Vps4 family AAA+-type ATPase
VSRLQTWRLNLGPGGAALNGALTPLAEQFELPAATIAQVARDWQHSVQPSAATLWQATRKAARRSLDGLADRIDARATWADLVLPDATLLALRTMAAQVRQRHRVLHDWGFAQRSARGLGLGALFAGGSGTGKTMAAEVLANELQLDLVRIDLAALVSKYIGETEKNLSRVFAAAEASGAILLFDEADALFGKRSEVRDSHDRYANLEVSYLLQRIESWRGLAILTSNMRHAIDSAFLRRLRFIVNFPFPDDAARAQIWQRAFPPAAPQEGLDMAKLARLSLSGGHIRNVALNAAFLAADEARAIGMRHMRMAAEAEFAKIEKPLPAGDVGDWL